MRITLVAKAQRMVLIGVAVSGLSAFTANLCPEQGASGSTVSSPSNSIAARATVPGMAKTRPSISVDGVRFHPTRVAPGPRAGTYFLGIPNARTLSSLFRSGYHKSDVYLDVGGKFVLAGHVTAARRREIAGRYIVASARAPRISSEPSDVSVAIGTRTTFSANAKGSPTPSVVWMESGNHGASWSVVPGATKKTYSVTASSMISGHEFEAVFANAIASVTSRAATLSVLSVNASLSTSTPSNVTVDAGQTATFSTTASNGTSPYSYQWQVSTGGAYSNVSSGTGATTATYTTASLTTGSNANTYRVIVTDSAAVPTSVTSGAATLTVNAALSTSTPSSQTISLSVSNTATFSTVVSGGTAPYTYQWQVDPQGISTFMNVSTGSGGTTANYTTGPLSISGNDGDLYRVIVTDSAGVQVSVISGNASLTVVS